MDVILRRITRFFVKNSPLSGTLYLQRNCETDIFFSAENYTKIVSKDVAVNNLQSFTKDCCSYFVTNLHSNFC